MLAVIVLIIAAPIVLYGIAAGAYLVAEGFR
jgi:hypothetical protein